MHAFPIHIQLIGFSRHPFNAGGCVAKLEQVFVADGWCKRIGDSVMSQGYVGIESHVADKVCYVLFLERGGDR